MMSHTSLAFYLFVCVLRALFIEYVRNKNISDLDSFLYALYCSADKVHASKIMITSKLEDCKVFKINKAINKLF